MWFSPYLAISGGGGAPKGSRTHNLLMQFSSLGNSKMEISESDFFNTLTIQNDQISYVKHVLAPFYLFFTLFGCAGGGGGLPRGLGHNLLMQITEDKAPKQFNNSPLADKRVRVLLATSSPARVSKRYPPIAPQALVSALQRTPPGLWHTTLRGRTPAIRICEAA